MTISASVTRDATPIGEFEFVTMPREGEVVSIDGTEGEVQRVEHIVSPDEPPQVAIFIDNEE